MLDLASCEDTEPDAHIGTLEKLRIYYQLKAFKERDRLEELNNTIQSMKEKRESWESVKTARSKAIRDGKQKPAFLEGDIQEDKCMGDIEQHFGGQKKVDLIFAIWALHLLPLKNPEDSDSVRSSKYKKNLTKVLQQWSNLLTP